MFSEELEKYPWDEVTDQIYSKTANDVETALCKEHLSVDDFMAWSLLPQLHTWNRWRH